MACKMFSVGLVVLAFVGMSLCQPQQQLNAGLSPQYSQSAKPQESSGALPQQSQFYQDAVQQQNLAQSYQTPFENTGVQYSVVTPNSYPGNQDSQQYYVPTTQQSAAPQIITKESYSASLPTVIPTFTSAQVQPDYRPQFATPTQTLQDISATYAAQAEQEYIRHQEYRHQHLASIAQAQAEYKQQFAALEQAQLEYKQQFTALSQAQQELKQQFTAPVEAQQELKRQFAGLAQTQEEYNQQFSTLAQAQKEYKQQFAALNGAQQDLKQHFDTPAHVQQEYKQLFANLAREQLESKQQFATLTQAQKELNQQFVVPAQIPHEQRFITPAKQVYTQQNVVPDQGRQDYRQRFIVPTPTYQYIQKSTTATAAGPINYSNIAHYPAAQVKSQTVTSVQPKFQYATIPQQYQQQQYYNTLSTEQPRFQKSETNQSSSGIAISTTPTSLKESVVYKSESTPTLRQ